MHMPKPGIYSPHHHIIIEEKLSQEIKFD